MTYFEKIKSFLSEIMNSKKQDGLFKKIKKNTFVSQNTITLLNIDTTTVLDKYKLYTYILSLIKKHPTHNIVFDNCKIEDIKVTLNKSVLFKNCEITNLKLDQNSICSSKFEECIFKFDNSEQRIFIHTSWVEFNKCTTIINNSENCAFAIGNSDNSKVSIKNHNFENKNDMYFKININADNLTIHNYNAPDCVELLINNMPGKTNDCIHIKNSTTVFSTNNIAETNIILIEDSTVKSLNANSQSIEISGENNFNNVQILNCEDISIDNDSYLGIKNTNINTESLECSDNSAINDFTNKFKWLTNISRINVGKNFKLLYNDKVIYEKKHIDCKVDDNKEILDVIKIEGKMR